MFWKLVLKRLLGAGAASRLAPGGTHLGEPERCGPGEKWPIELEHASGSEPSAGQGLAKGSGCARVSTREAIQRFDREKQSSL